MSPFVVSTSIGPLQALPRKELSVRRLLHAFAVDHRIVASQFFSVSLVGSLRLRPFRIPVEVRLVGGRKVSIQDINHKLLLI
jgi:hypothetical protein